MEVNINKWSKLLSNRLTNNLSLLKCGITAVKSFIVQALSLKDDPKSVESKKLFTTFQGSVPQNLISKSVYLSFICSQGLMLVFYYQTKLGCLSLSCTLALSFFSLTINKKYYTAQCCKAFFVELKFLSSRYAISF